jgi:hypothetical protein
MSHADAGQAGLARTVGPPGSVHVDVGAVHVDLGTVHVNVGAVHVNVGAVHVDVGTVHVDVGTVHIDVGRSAGDGRRRRRGRPRRPPSA